MSNRIAELDLRISVLMPKYRQARRVLARLDIELAGLIKEKLDLQRQITSVKRISAGVSGKRGYHNPMELLDSLTNEQKTLLKSLL